MSTVQSEFSDRLRSVTRLAVGETPLRTAGEEMGLGFTVLHRFLQGRPATGPTIDRIVRWLDSKGWRL